MMLICFFVFLSSSFNVSSLSSIEDVKAKKNSDISSGLYLEAFNDGVAKITTKNNGRFIVENASIINSYGITLLVNDISKNEESYSWIKSKIKNDNNILIFDFRYLDCEGTEINVREKSLIKILIPNISKNALIYFIDKNGNKEFVDFQFIDGYISFEFDKQGYLAISEKTNLLPSNPSNGESKHDEKHNGVNDEKFKQQGNVGDSNYIVTGQRNIYPVIIFILVVSLLVMAVLIRRIRKK